MPCICRVYTLQMLIMPKDYMHNGNPQIITKSDFTQWFPHMLSPEISKPCLSPPLHFYPPSWRNIRIIHCCVLCFFSAHLVVVVLGSKSKKQEKEKQKAQLHQETHCPDRNLKPWNQALSRPRWKGPSLQVGGWWYQLSPPSSDEGNLTRAESLKADHWCRAGLDFL